MRDNQKSTTPFRNRIAAIWKSIHNSLSTHLTFTIFTTTFLLVGLSAFILDTYITRRVNLVTEDTLVGIAATYEDVLHYPLMSNDRSMLDRMISDIGSQNHAKTVRVFNSEGVVVASSVPNETGIRLDRKEPRCQTCHTTRDYQIPVTEFQSFNDSTHEVILVANPIENRIACQSCHSEEQKTLGLIFVEFPREQFEDWNTLLHVGLSFSALLLATLISSVLYLSVSSTVIQPLKMLTNFWELKPSVGGENEIGQISRYLRHMRAAVDEKDKEIAVEHKKIDYIFSIQYSTENPPSLEKFFQQSLGIIQDITGFSAITLRLYDPQSQSFQIMAHRGLTLEMLRDLKTVPAETGFHAEIIQTHKPVFTSDLPHDPRLMSSAPISEGYRSLACIPLLAQDVMVGSMQLVTKDEYIWSENDRRWLGLIGRRLGLLIHQIQLSERLRDMAVLEERSRIAQEIHDGLAQLVGAMRIWSEEALVSLEDHDLTSAQRAVEKIDSASRDAYASLREEILGMRESIYLSKDLSAFLSEYLRRFQRQWGIQAKLQVDQCSVDLDSMAITPAAEIQLLRIFQEGLTNVRRHANASWIIVALSCADGWLILRIRDDGSGFDLQNIPDDRLGLRIMRERVASAGGNIAITSQIGQGTQLEIKIPLRVIQNAGMVEL